MLDICFPSPFIQNDASELRFKNVHWYAFGRQSRSTYFASCVGDIETE